MTTRKTARVPQGVYVSNAGPMYYDQNGNGFFGNLWKGAKKAGKFIKDKGVISKALTLAGRPGLAGAAKMVGLGNAPVVIVAAPKKKAKRKPKRKVR